MEESSNEGWAGILFGVLAQPEERDIKGNARKGGENSASPGGRAFQEPPNERRSDNVMGE